MVYEMEMSSSPGINEQLMLNSSHGQHEESEFKEPSLLCPIGDEYKYILHQHHCSSVPTFYLVFVLVQLSLWPLNAANRKDAPVIANEGFKGYLDEQFNQLEELQDESSPNFVEEVVALFFKDSSRLLTNIEQAIEKYPQDFYRLDSLVHQLKGSGSSIGALRMKNECSVFKAHCDDKNLEGCRRSFEKMKREHATLKQKLEQYFQLLRQVSPREHAVSSRK